MGRGRRGARAGHGEGHVGLGLAGPHPDPNPSPNQPLKDLHDVGRSYIELELLLARELGEDLGVEGASLDAVGCDDELR